jgi:hypothetical protein
MISGTGSPDEAIEDTKARREIVLSIARLSLPTVRRIAVLAAIAMIVASGAVVAHALTIDQPNPIATPPPPVTVTLTGTVAVGNSVIVIGEEGGIEPVCDSTVDAAGNWSCSIPLAADGTFTFVVTELDPEGATVASDFRTVLVQPPPPPTTTTTPPQAVVTVPARFTG